MLRQRVLLALLIVSVLLAACNARGLPLRSDLPLEKLTRGVTYTRDGAAGTDEEQNQSLLRGINSNSPLLEQETIFGKMTGVKTEDVIISGVPVLGMGKYEREYGYSNNFEVETAYFHARDSLGQNLCGAKIRLQFNRNADQYPKTKLRDFDTIWWYSIPCSESDFGKYDLAIDEASLISLTVNEVWQPRLYWTPVIINWGHSVVLVGGYPSLWPAGWWLNGDIPGEEIADSLGTTNLMLSLVNDLATSSTPWLGFDPDSTFTNTTAIYSAGDADQYAHADRILLGRQHEYAVFYRPDAATAWDFITIEPRYNFEWNDADQIWGNITQGWAWGTFDDQLNPQGLPKDANSSVIAEIEKYGCQNCPSPALDQLLIKDKTGTVIYAITLRAFYGANDTLVLFGGEQPPRFDDFATQVPFDPSTIPPMPVLYNERGDPLPESDQQFKDESQWVDFMREATVWNWHEDNPTALPVDLKLQYRVIDNSTWAPIPCSDGGTCGYEPIEWKLNASYMWDGNESNTRKAWLILNLLGEVGTRTTGFSYASNRFQGNGIIFALAQEVFNQRYECGFNTVEDIFALDARAMTLPSHLAEAWGALHGTQPTTTCH